MLSDTAPVVVPEVPAIGGDRSAARGSIAAPVRVLIADDAPEARFLLRVWLERHGGMDLVAEARDGVEAVARAQQERPDLVLLDVSMPRMDGLEAAVEIRRSLPDTRIVLFSAFSADRMTERALLAGADVYLEKKFGPEQIFAVIGDLFGVQPVGPGPPAAGAVAVELDRHETLLRLLFDALDEGVIVVDQDGRVESMNFAATTLLGIETSQSVGRPLTDLFVDATDADGRQFDADRPDPITETLRSGRPRSGVVVGTRRSDGERMWLSANVRPIAPSGPRGDRGAIATLNDVTAARALRCELAAAAVRTQSVLDASAGAVLVVNAVRGGNGAVVDRRVAWGNRAALAGTGWDIGTHLGACPARPGAQGGDAELTDRIADALGRADAALGARPGRDADAPAQWAGVKWFRGGDDEVVLTWDVIGPPREGR